VITRRARREQAVHRREPERHRLEGRADDLNAARVQSKAADRSTPPIAPSRRALAGQVRKDREAVIVRRQRRQSRFDLLVASEP